MTRRLPKRPAVEDFIARGRPITDAGTWGPDGTNNDGFNGWELRDDTGHVWRLSETEYDMHMLRRTRGSGGAPERYRWDEITPEVLERARRDGIPANLKPQQVFMRWLCEAFRARGCTEAELPGETMLKRHAKQLANAWDANIHIESRPEPRFDPTVRQRNKKLQS